jgi:hypothetical protein
MRVSPKANDFEYVHSALTKEQARWGGGAVGQNGDNGHRKSCSSGDYSLCLLCVVSITA